MSDRLHGRVLVVDDEPEVLELTALALRGRGYLVQTAASAAAAVAAACVDDFDAVLTDLHLDGGDGLDLCAQLLAMRPSLPIVVVTGDATLGAAVAAMRAGAFDYLTKPVDGEMLVLTTERAIKLHRLESEVTRLREAATSPSTSGEILGKSAGIEHVRDVIARIASTSASVLITGESGTGKELVARAVHARSPRARGPFVALNCAALPHELLESELFGHARGAFTDAKTARKGLFLEANGGTLFLDEIGEMPLATQVKLLRALQERTVRPVGGTGEMSFDARLITATNRDLSADVAAKQFREDLYYRINVVTIHVPPLRQRRVDIPVLAEAFLQRFATQQDKNVRTISPAAMERLAKRSWPGNVRELENAVERAVSMARTDSLGAHDFATDVVTNEAPAAVLDRDANPTDRPAAHVLPGAIEDLVSADVAEWQYIQHVLRVLDGNRSRAALALGYDRRTLHRKLKRGLEAAASKSAASLPLSTPSPAAGPPSAEKVRVLIVDADLDSRELLQIVLEASGLVVASASNLGDALGHGPMNIVLTELKLPDGLGSELLKRMHPIPVIALSAERPAVTDAFSAWLGKPAPAAEVLTAIDRALKRGHFAHAQSA